MCGNESGKGGVAEKNWVRSGYVLRTAGCPRAIGRDSIIEIDIWQSAAQWPFLVFLHAHGTPASVLEMTMSASD